MARLHQHLIIDYAVRQFTERSVREANAALRAKIDTSVCALLGVGTFDAGALAELAARPSYAIAFSALVRAGKLSERHLAAMTDPASDSLQPFRVAIAFGVIPARCGPEPFGINELKQIKTAAAKCAMAACGVIEWKTASRRVRAVFALRELIGSRRS